jgi:hypothetical protein
MHRNGIFSLITLILIAPSFALACNWVRVGEFGESLECRSNYKEFFGTNSQALSKLLMEAAYYAVGEAEKNFFGQLDDSKFCYR